MERNTQTKLKREIIAWIRDQETSPNRKTVQKAFPDVSARMIRAALQSVEDGKSEGGT